MTSWMPLRRQTYTPSTTNNDQLGLRSQSTILLVLQKYASGTCQRTPVTSTPVKQTAQLTSSSSINTLATGSFFGPPSSGWRANGETGTRSTCFSVYVNASCTNTALMTVKRPRPTEPTRNAHDRRIVTAIGRPRACGVCGGGGVGPGGTAASRRGRV